MGGGKLRGWRGLFEAGKQKKRRGVLLTGKLLAVLALWSLTAYVLVLKGPHHAWSGIYLTEVVLLVLLSKIFGRIPLSVFSS